MKRSLREIAKLTSERISDENIESLAKTVWFELQSNKKFSSLNELIKLIRQMKADKEGRKIAEITTPVELSIDEQEKIRKKVEDRIKGKVLPIFKIDKNILGGIKIKIEDEELDFSWRGKLQLIRTKLEGKNE